MLFATGLTGLVGRVLVDEAQRRGIALAGLRRDPAGEEDPRVRWCRGSLLDPETYRDDLVGIDAILHLAARTGAASAEEFDRVNAEGTRRLIDAARERGVRRIVFVSTIAVRFGNLESYPYARSKRAAEECVRDSGLDWTIVRPTLVLGRGAGNLEKLAALARLPVVPLIGGGRVRLQPVDVRDLAGVLLDACQSALSAEVVEVGGPEVVTMRELLRRIRRSVGKGSAHQVPIPLFPLRVGAALGRAVLGDRAPLTPAQLSSFVEDAVAEPHPFVQERSARFRSLEATLDDALSR